MLNSADNIKVTFLTESVGENVVNITEDNKEALHCCTFFYVADGDCEITINGQEYSASTGRLFLMPYEIRESDFKISSGKQKTYEFNFDLFINDSGVLKLLTEVRDIQVPEKELYVPLGLFQDFNKMQNASLLSDMLLQKSIILHLLAYFIGFISLSDPEFMKMNKLQPVITYIENNLDKKMTVGELSKIVHQHPNYFFRYFKNIMGVTPVEYINSLRIERAKELLAGNLPIMIVAKKSGFSSEYYFSRFFRAKTGFSPSEFRARNTADNKKSI